MRNGRIVVLFVLIAGVIGTVLLRRSPAQTDNTKAPPAARVAVCDIVVIFKEYKKVEKLKAELDEKERKLEAESMKRAKELEVLAKEIQELKQGSDLFEKRSTDLIYKGEHFKVWQKIERSKLMKWHYQETKQMFREILAAAEQIARRKGFDLVLAREPDKLQARDSNELVQEMVTRKILYHGPSLNITDAVLAHVNLTYLSTKP